jgi:PAS domain S-box-containing protein
MRLAPAEIFAGFRYLLYERTIPVVAVLFCVGVAGILWHLSSLSSNLIESTAVQNAALYADSLAEFRKLYASEVVARAQSHGMQITHDYVGKADAIPLPATMSLLLGNRIADKGSGGEVRLYSAYPFPWRKDGGPRDDFERNALARLRQSPGQPVYRYEEYGGRRVLRYVIADRMQATCVACHNSHAQSSKTDWKTGEVGGGLEIILPLDRAVAQADSGLQGTFALMVTLVALGLAGLAIVIRKLRRTSVTLEQHVAERTAALRQSEERTRSIIDSALDAMIGLDANGTITDWNPRAEAIFGWARSEALGRPLTETIIPTRFRDMCVRGLQELVAAGDRAALTRRVELVAVRRDGEEFPIEFSVSPLKTGDTYEFAAFIADITDRKRLEEAFQQAQKMDAVGRLAGGIAHDFNNLLTVITGYCQLLLNGLGPVGTVGHQIEQIKTAADRAATLTNQLLAFSRKQILQPRVLNLNEVVQSTEKLLRRLIGEDVELATRLDPALGQVKADPGQIDQVIMNLAINARDAMPQGGRLTIETANAELDERYARRHPVVPPGPYVMLAVTDTGHGMDQETQSRIFEPFYTTKERGKGTGLGLATVYGIVKQSGGFIWVYSELGRGTTFKIYLPRVDEEVESAGADRFPREAPRGAETVLMTEDDELVRTLIRTTLQDQGYTVLEARNGAEALRISQEYKGPIHLLVTDVVMPGMNGRELAERLACRCPALRVLYLSGYTGETVVRNGVLEAERAFLPKPFSPAAFAHKVREVLNEPRGDERDAGSVTVVG